MRRVFVGRRKRVAGYRECEASSDILEQMGQQKNERSWGGKKKKKKTPDQTKRKQELNPDDACPPCSVADTSIDDPPSVTVMPITEVTGMCKSRERWHRDGSVEMAASSEWGPWRREASSIGPSRSCAAMRVRSGGALMSRPHLDAQVSRIGPTSA